MKILSAIIIILIILIFSNGCASYMVMQNSKEKIARTKAYASNNQAAIRAIDLGEGAVGIGIDINNLEALTEHPWKQLGAALLDLASFYGAYKGAEKLNDPNKSTTNPSTTPDNTKDFNITGNNNVINVFNSSGSYSVNGNNQ
jgi:hypothetical protein